MFPAWKPELASPKCIADAIALECEAMDFGVETLRRAEPGGMNALALSPISLMPLVPALSTFSASAPASVWLIEGVTEE
jgi:hypothetical protein